MPLTKLFQRRNSSQKDKKSLTSAELSASDTVTEVPISNEEAETKTGKNSESCSVEDKCKSSAGLEKTAESEISDVPRESDEGNDESCDISAQSETSRRCSIPETTSDIKEHLRNKSRSLSLKESGTKQNVQRTRRRKCDSESAAFSSTDDEGFEDKVIQLRERDLEKVIGQCVDRLIRESILTAVRSVKVDQIYEDVMKSLSRSASESSDASGSVLEPVPQKLHTDSVSEYADLQMVHTFEEEILEDEEPNETEDSKLSNESEASSDQLESNIQSESGKNDCTEAEEDLKSETAEKCFESELVYSDKMADYKTSESNIILNPVVQTESDTHGSTTSVEALDSSTSLDKNKDILTNTQADDADKLNTLVESKRDSIKDKEIYETDEQEQNEEECHSVKTEILRETQQNEIIGDTVDCAKRQKNHSLRNEDFEEVRELKDELIDGIDNSKIEVEETKEMDGYHADIEESISLHSVVSESTSLQSMASESSLENSKDSKSYNRSTSDDTTFSSAEGNLDETPKKVACESPKPQHDVDKIRKNLNVEADLMAMSGDDFSQLLAPSESTADEASTPAADLGENLPEQKTVEEEKKVNWKVGYLHVKLPHKSRYKGLKVWKKRCVAIQPDEFANDDSDHCLVLSVYSGDSSAAKKHSASFWKSISCQKAVIYRSSSRTHPYSFTISDDKKAVIHLAADSEAISQEWMAAIRAILWPPSPVVQLEKMLNGKEFELSIIDSEFSYHAGLLGMYGYLTITPKKLTLVHPQQGYVIQEWYLNTIDKFQLIPQTRIEDVNKVLSMTTCSDSSTGKGDILIFCKEAVSLLQEVASTIHQILSHHSKQEGGGKYQKELEEIGEWLVGDSTPPEDYYKVPPRQVKSLLDIPNFIFDKPISPVATVSGTPGVAMDSQKSTIDAPKANPTRASQDSGIASETVSDDFLNCSTTSFLVGGEKFPGKSSDSELSDTYTPPRSPEVQTRNEGKFSGKTADT